MRLPDALRVSVDQWAAENKMSRSEAIRALIERGLSK
jgi:metal-responsive CopG/Arc/MetJ family transcriptional regulator